ncbi:MAG: hypothetical protein JWR80_602 [Bradyrhizobium sp.]|nr:hypothetical protein [Bradyrhizobium sp.]
MIGYMSPIYSGLRGLDYDPAYPYLFNGAGLMKGYNPSLVEHPGTPVQLLAGIFSIMAWSVATLFGLTSLAFAPSIAANPEEYLRVVMTAFLVMNCIAVYWLGAAIARSTRFMVAGIACQTAYLLFGTLFPRIFHAAPEAIVCLSATGLMAALVPALFADEDCSDRRAVAVGFFIGLGIASKATFLPLLLLAFLLRRPRPILIALSASALWAFFFLLPIFDKLKRAFSFLFSIVTHVGRHGDGATGFIDWAVIPERVALIASAEPMLVVAAIAVAAAMLFSNSGDRLKAVIIAAALGTAILLVLKHYAIHYLMPAVAIAPAIIVWAISRFARRPTPYIAAAAIASVIGAVAIQNMSSSFANERALRRENEKAVNDVIARYKDPVVIGAYRAGYKPLGIVIGLAWSDLKFARLFSQTTDTLVYDAGLKKPWRAHSGAVDWSHLDQFEKAGRAVLVVQSRNDRIEPQTARTETLLDQGFGDTVERIIVSPKVGDK